MVALLNVSDAVQRLAEFDREGRYVFSSRDMAKVFLDDTPRAREATLNRLVARGILERPSKGVYLFALSGHKGTDTLELIARILRRGAYNYVSLESALSEYGLISQIPVDRLTVMTTGRKGEYVTPYGTIEFTHTKRPTSDILASIVECGRPLPMATQNAALRDLRRVGRNLHLVEEETFDEL
jgi:predicted transcriptional regulator of viral defense system